MGNLLREMLGDARAKAEVGAIRCENDRVQFASGALCNGGVEFANHRAVHDVGFWRSQADSRHPLVMRKLQANFLEVHFCAPSVMPCAVQGAISSISSSLQRA